MEYSELTRLSRVNANKARLMNDAILVDKNRYENILVYNDTRVSLKPRAQEPTLSDTYINACYVDGPL
jgi:protein tyrosine phosphatase